MRPITISVGPLVAASANNIALSQTPAAAFTLNGSTAVAGVATLDNPRRVLFTSADSTHTATIVGTNWSGNTATEVVAMTGTTAVSLLDYKTITSITASGLFTAAVTVGTNGVAGSPWARLDEWAMPGVSIQCDVSGTVNYTVQATNDDPNDPTFPVLPAAVTWIPTNDPAGVAATAAILTNYINAPTYVRLLLNSGTGTVTMKVIQYNVASY